MSEPARHYPSETARLADLVVHIVGLTFAAFGGVALVGLAVGLHPASLAAPITIYASGLLIMLALSTAYNFARIRWRPLLRRFDHAGIFLMIAGSYTPFTTQRLHGAWAIGMTAAVWLVAGLGIAGKLMLPGLGRRIWVVLYLALGWLVLVAVKPMTRGLSPAPLVLLVLGGLVYTIGAVFYVLKSLTFRRAIWHGHVVGGSILHYIAVLVGVVLARGPY